MTLAERILVVDDEEVIRDLLTEVLADDGYDVHAAHSGPAALDLIRDRDGFALLFTDIMMPDMTGIELIREARTVAPDLIPIVMTAYATVESARAAVQEGAYDYVLKPFSLSEVKLAVSNALERHRLANENARLRELTELFNISERIATIHDERGLYDYVLRAALQRVDATRGSIMVLTESGRSMEIKCSVGLPREAMGATVDIASSISGRVAETAAPLLVPDMADRPDVERISRHEDGSFISVPLESKGKANGRDNGGANRVMAVLNVRGKRSGGAFSDGDLKTLSIVANHAAAAMQNVMLIKDIERSHIATIESMALLLEARDVYTQCHSQRVRDISVAIARSWGMPQSDIDILRLGAAFHDIGKVGVPDQVLNKPSRLDDHEWELIRRHPAIGYGVLEPIHFLAQGHLEVVRGHHERIDGHGYPDGLSGSDVTPLMRITAVADSYDAMAADRAYRKALPREVIVEEMKKGSGGQFDPKVVQTLFDLLESGAITNGV
jgi:response regulator RpfG family c-di-GMP phosphodiesterase